MQNDYMERTHNGTTFVGSDVTIFQALALAQALKLYATTGMQINRAYTPTAMLRAASSFTGQRYKRGQYMEAAAGLQNLAEWMKQNPRVDDTPLRYVTTNGASI